MNEETKTVVNRIVVKRDVNPLLFEHLHWVAAAVAKQDLRDYLNSIHVTDNRIEATDGHRLHRVDFPAVTDDGNPGGVPYVLDGDIVAPLQGANWIVGKRLKASVELARAPQDSFDRWPNTDRVVPGPNDDILVKGTLLTNDSDKGSAGGANYALIHHELFLKIGQAHRKELARVREDKAFKDARTELVRYVMSWPYYLNAVEGMARWTADPDMGPFAFYDDGVPISRTSVVMPCRI